MLLSPAAVFAADSATQQSANLLPNPGFELLQEAAANPMPQKWNVVKRGTSADVRVAEGPNTGNRAIRIAAAGEDAAGLNSDPLDVQRGTVRFRYKITTATVPVVNTCMFVIGLSDSGVEGGRVAFVPPSEHVGDAEWHDGSFHFDLSSAGRRCLVAPRVNEQTSATGSGEWLVDSFEVIADAETLKPKLSYVWSSKPLAVIGDTVTFSAFVENAGTTTVPQAELLLTINGGMATEQPTRSVTQLKPGSFERIDWNLSADREGTVTLQAVLKCGDYREDRDYRILVVPARKKVDRRQVCTDQSGYWRVLPHPETLQKGNTSALVEISKKRSSEIGRSPYGLCAHLPRSKDYEDPFNPGHVVDNDSTTCWSSQQRPSTFPGNPPWIKIDLPAAAAVSQVNLVPYWNNSDFPLGFTVLGSTDGTSWTQMLRVTQHQFEKNGPRREDKIVQQFPLPAPAAVKSVRISFDRLPLAGGNYAEVSQGYKARVSGIELMSEEGENLASAEKGARAEASEFFTGWQNTLRTVNEPFDRIFDLGVKYVRVGQWGDQTEWAAVEREKGKFQVDPVTDAGIQRLLDNGVDILFGLQYGNAVHERPEKPWGELGPIYKEGHPFYLNNGPRTEAGRKAFTDYVDYVVRRYGKRIRWWELWNEENGWYPTHEPELYGKLLFEVGKRIKSIDPALKVMFGGTAAPAPNTVDVALQQGGAPYVDAYAFHPYGIDKPEGGMGTMEWHGPHNKSLSREQTGWNRLEDIIAGVKKPFEKHGRPEVEIWMNEWSLNVTGLDYSYNPGIGEYGLAKYLLRFYIYAGWLKVPTAWWALYNENKSQDWSILDHDFGFRPLSFALQNVCSFLSDVEPVRNLQYRCSAKLPDLKVIGYVRDGTSESLALLWNAEGHTDDVRSYPADVALKSPAKPAAVTLTDLYWGQTQDAVWEYESGEILLRGLTLRDYPVCVSWK